MRITGATARRWTVPVAAAAAFVAAGPVAGLLTSAHADLPPRSAQQLLVDLQKADLKGLSGTVVETANLGLPSLPEGLAPAGADPLALLSGSHTLRIWSAGPAESRVALLSSFGESDLVRHGSDVWAWTSSNHQAIHWTVPTPTHQPAEHPLAEAVPMTPQQAADKALAALDPTTQVTDAGTTTVAGRAAYLLQLTPRSTTTLVGSIQIAIDGATHVPTRVQVFAQGSSAPALSIGFTHFDPSTPSASAFRFKPGPGVTVKQGSTETHAWSRAQTPRSPMTHVTPVSQPKVTGTGWGTVVVATLPPDALAKSGSGQAAGLLRTLPTVSGSWGSGHLLQGTLFSVLLTDDGRVAVGAVPPDQLYAALG